MKQTEISDRGLVRLIPATYHKPPALRGLVDTDDEMEILAQIESLTSARLLAERGRNPHLDPRELAWQRRSRYGDSHVNAAFTYTRVGGNRFNTEERGAWYCAWDVMVSVSEVAWHRTRELGFTGSYHDSGRYVELLADFIGAFDDMTDASGHPALHADPAVGYPEGQSLAQHLRRAGSRGLIYPSVRAPKPGGNCLVCFEPHAIQSVRPGASWDLVWDGTQHSRSSAHASASVSPTCRVTAMPEDRHGKTSGLDWRCGGVYTRAAMRGPTDSSRTGCANAFRFCPRSAGRKRRPPAPPHRGGDRRDAPRKRRYPTLPFPTLIAIPAPPVAGGCRNANG